VTNFVKTQILVTEQVDVLSRIFAIHQQVISLVDNSRISSAFR